MYELPFVQNEKENTVFCDGGRLFVSINFAGLQSKNMQTAVIPTVVLCDPFIEVLCSSLQATSMDKSTICILRRRAVRKYF